MKVAGLMLGGLAALAGCAAIAGPSGFRLTSEQVSGAWGLSLARAQMEAEEQGLSPLWDPWPPAYSGASCRWIEPGRKARCRYRVSRGPYRRGSVRRWADDEAEFYLREGRWDLGG
jgi:hypothetical protein